MRNLMRAMRRMARSALVGGVGVGLVVGVSGCFGTPMTKVIPLSVVVTPESGPAPLTVTVRLPPLKAQLPVKCALEDSITPTIYMEAQPSGTEQEVRAEFTPPFAGPDILQCWTGDDRPTEGVVDAFYSTPIKATGSRVDPSSSGSCTVATTDTLVFKADGSVLVSSTGPGIIDHINCTQSSPTTWLIEGKGNPKGGPVVYTMTSCNTGRFQAAGTINVYQGKVSGSTTCSYNGEVRNTQTYGG